VFGFCVVGDEKQERDIQIQFRSYRPNRRDESRYAPKTDYIIPHNRKKCKSFFVFFLKKSCFSFIINNKKSKKSLRFFVFSYLISPRFLPKREKNVHPDDKNGRKTAGVPGIFAFERTQGQIKLNSSSNSTCPAPDLLILEQTFSTREWAARSYMLKSSSKSAGGHPAPGLPPDMPLRPVFPRVTDRVRMDVEPDTVSRPGLAHRDTVRAAE